MTFKRSEVWLADLNPTRGSEQAGTRPVLIFQNDLINKFTTTVLTIPFTTNLRRASLPSCVKVSKGEGGLTSDSVALCHQLRVLDKTRLQRKLGELSEETMAAIESRVVLTMGIE
ncbi:MAG TPA: type II toxin-antitoxin system PemK/MazF family toxin [Blastocatellia bacterium]|nr:type II toxin-antitoxin system PemK/MazF family toxin [Blastocatellia bacterium]